VRTDPEGEKGSGGVLEGVRTAGLMVKNM